MNSKKCKKCSKCEVVKSFDEFHKEKPAKDGQRSQCKECIKEYSKQRYEANKEKIIEYSKQYYQDNKEERLEYNKEYCRNRRANDATVALRHNVSGTIHKALTRNGGGKDGESVLQYLPYTIEQLKEHLESQFEDWMNWSNQGKWHIDHIHPQSLLPYDNMRHPNFLKAWALENLQPLEAKENMSKGNKV